MRKKLDIQSSSRGAQIVLNCQNDAEKLKAAAEKLDRESIPALQDLLATICDQESLSDDDFKTLFEDGDTIDLGCDACELLGHMHAGESLSIVLRFLSWLDEVDESDTLVCRGPDILGTFPSETAVQLIEFAIASNAGITTKNSVLEGVKRLVDQEPAVQQSLAPLIIKGLGNAKKLDPAVNSNLMMLAVDWKLSEAAEVIEHAFADNRIDCGFAGSWDDVRRMLHIEGLRLPMPQKPINSVIEFRRNVGIGAFSEEPLFLSGEIQEAAAGAYLDTACEVFARSTEGKALLGPSRYPNHVCGFLELGLNYLGVSVENMTPADAQELLLEIFPSKVNLDAADSDLVINELIAFWMFCNRVHEIEQALRIAKQLDKIRHRFHHAMKNPANFGMAKSFFIAGQQAGFDMTSQEGMSAFMRAYNESIPSGRSIPSPSPVQSLPSDRRFDPPQIEPQIPHQSLKSRKKLLAKLNKRKK